MRRIITLTAIAAVALSGMFIGTAGLLGQDRDVIPHAQDKPPGPALSPSEALAAMTVPEGFTVELVTSEPEIINPVAMTFDEKGRIWITESLEYPRREPGPGRDRVKILEDTNGDGSADRVTIFADGLNIPSGIAVGHGGVWVANSPDILFYPDADRDGVADGPPEVVVTGFGRDDTHELPNSLTWGPDGWLYGWNGVFNRSKVTNRKGETFDFTCAVFRIHPKTRDFELFSEGVSNPWGIAINENGDLFASACVIDHLWHMTETGYYIRQGGPYPPHTWPIRSIVDHKHQKAAYCGITFFDSDAYPPEYRERLYMGNIHGNCINVDELSPNGSTYKGAPAPDFLSANDAWFMPVVQKTGPDGCLYILDWYDRYHCYQDANRDPEGIDRLKGRLYRVRYNDTPRRAGFDLGAESDESLIGLLASANVYDREIAQRLLTERLMNATAEAATGKALETFALDQKAPRKARLHALWAVLSGGKASENLTRGLLADDDATLRAWGIRGIPMSDELGTNFIELVEAHAADPSPEVRLQAAIAARKIGHADPVQLLLEVLAHSGDDPLIPHIVWQNLHPLLDTESDAFASSLETTDLDARPGIAAILPRALDRLLASAEPAPEVVAGLLGRLVASQHHETARQALDHASTYLRQFKLDDPAGEPFREALQNALASGVDGPLANDVLLALAYCGEARGLAKARHLFRGGDQNEGLRLRALDVLLHGEDPDALRAAIDRVLNDAKVAGSEDFRGKVLGALNVLDDPELASIILAAYPKLQPNLRPRAIELLTARPSWGKALVAAVEAGDLSRDAVNVNQLRKLQGTRDDELVAAVRTIWGTVREGRDSQREQVINQMRGFLRETPGDPHAGREIFARVCGQCHVIHGAGEEVGPDITLNGRNDFEQLLSNVFDPNLVIGEAYQATTVATTDGRILSGLLAEDNAERVVLKVQGGQRELIPRDDIDEMRTADISLMPEDLENQVTPQELADLFSFLTLDKPPTDPTARRLPGAPEPKAAASGDR